MTVRVSWVDLHYSAEMIGGEFSGSDIHEACPSAVLAVMASGMPGSEAARRVPPCRRPRLGPLAFVGPPG
jgi:hypothetical protein